jgi:AAA+ ATPase superfamily predicted ATPase
MIEPFGFNETNGFHSRFISQESATAYGITGGIPLYLEFMDDRNSICENIMKNFFNPNAYLFEEPTNLLKQEVRDLAHYNAIVRAIATGSSRNSEIASIVGLPTSATTAYLNNLIGLGIVNRDEPVIKATGRRAVYRISDGLYRFWYRFVPDYLPLIQNGMAERVW